MPWVTMYWEINILEISKKKQANHVIHLLWASDAMWGHQI